MNKSITIDNVVVDIINSSRAKHIRIRIKASNKVELVLPSEKYYEKGINFLKDKLLWIKNKTGQISSKQETFSNEITILEQTYKLILNCKEITTPIEIIENKIHISSSIHNDKAAPILAHFIKKTAKKEIESFALRTASKIGVKYNKISLRDTISRWGSCSRTGNISLSWRLALAPKFVLHYVIIHELCHLIEMNHSIKFWNLVKQHYPDYLAAKSWLKINGKKLYKLI